MDWLWFPYIPFGKLTSIQGNVGEGKEDFRHIQGAELIYRGNLNNYPDFISKLLEQYPVRSA